jgi:hypothetical protein
LQTVYSDRVTGGHTVSGVIPDPIITISDMKITQSMAADPYYMLSFPTRVKVTGVNFILAGGQGIQGDGLEYTLFIQKGRHARVDEGNPNAEDIVPFFPWDGKPKVICDSNNKFFSDVVAPLDKTEWFAYSGPAYTADVAQMDTDEYLCLWVELTGWNTLDNFDADLVRASVSIAYTGATNID